MSGTDFEKLQIILSARDKDLAQAIDRNTKRIAGFANKTDKRLSRVSKKFDQVGQSAKRGLGAFAAGVASLASLNKLRSTVATLDEISNAARLAGVSAEEFQALAYAANTVGVSQEKLADIFKDVNDKVGDFLQTGAGPMADFFENIAPQVGLTADQFRRMSGPDALQAYVGALQQANVSQNEMTFYLEAIASDASALLPILQDNGSEMNRLAQEARDAGIIIDESLIAAAEKGKDKLALMSQVIDAQLSAALVNLVPFLVNAAGGIAAITNAATSFLNMSIYQPELLDADQLKEYASGFQGLERELGAMTQAQAAYNANVKEYGETSEQAQKWATQLADAEGKLSAAVADRKAEQDAGNSAVAQIQSITAQTEAAKEQLRLREMGAGAAERERISREKTAMVERLMANIRTSQGGIADGGQRAQVEAIAAEWEKAQLAASKIVNPIKRAGSATQKTKEKTDAYLEVMARIVALTGDADIASAGFAEIMAEIDALMESGAINGEQYADMIGEVESKFSDAARASRKVESAARDTFVAIVTGSESARDAVAGLLTKLAEMSAESAFNSLFGGSSGFDMLGGLFGGGGGKAKVPKGVPSFDGGGSTGNGSRSGGLDGKGGFMAMLHPKENVIDHTKLGGSAGGGGAGAMHVTIDVVGARGNMEIMDMVNAGTRQALTHYDRAVLPGRVSQIGQDRRRTK